MKAQHNPPSHAPTLLRFALAAIAGVVVVSVLLTALREGSHESVRPGHKQTSSGVVSGAIPELTRPVNDFANVTGGGRYKIERAIRALQSDTQDVIVVATVKSIAPFSDIRDYSLKMFENHGRGIGLAGKDNGVLVLLAVDERQVRITTGLGVEHLITDATATELVGRMSAYFGRGEIDAGLLAGVDDLAERLRAGRKLPANHPNIPARK